MSSKFENAQDALELILSTNPPEELKRKVSFFRTLSWDLDKKYHKRDTTSLVIVKGQAKDKRGIPALRFIVSYKIMDDSTEVLDFSNVELFDSAGSNYTWNNDTQRFQFANTEE